MITYQVFEDQKELYQVAAQLILSRIPKDKTFSLGLAAGRTPIALYAKLVELSHPETFVHVRTVGLDDFVGIPQEDERSFFYFTQKHLLNLRKFASSLAWNGGAKNIATECLCYEKAVHQQKGIDLQILGIGRNGHLGFNEPGTSFTSRSHVVKLSAATLQANEAQLNGAKVTQGITLGLANIFEAREIVLIAIGKEKSEAVKKAIAENPSEDCPASSLQSHDQVTFFLDREAASLLPAYHSR